MLYFMRGAVLLGLGLIIPLGPGRAQPSDQPATFSTELSAAALFALADEARDRGDLRSAETAYGALTNDPDPDLRNEARFRLAMMLADLGQRPREAAVELRRILDEKPHATRVRLELARIDAILGDLTAARRELRAAQAGKLPPEVEQFVRFFANALLTQKQAGGSLEVAIAPDSNINRATRADALGTVIGDFTLDEDARARSGLGLTLRGQSYLRFRLGQAARMLLRASGNANLYRASQFDDIAFGLQAGPEIGSGTDRFILSGGSTWRSYGNRPYSVSYGLSGDILHPLGKRAQLRAVGSVARIDNRRNDLQDGDAFALSVGIDRAFSPRLGGGMQISGTRSTARDPGYADATAAIGGYLFREIGRTTIVTGASYSHLEADARLFLYPARRRDDRISANLGGTFRALTLHTFAPFARLTADRNRSTVGIYAYTRIAAEFGLTSAF